jgi:hypothetical protein
MPIGPTFCGDLLQLAFDGIGITNIALNASASPSTALWYALHTAQPSSDAQTGSEAAYTGYLRISVNRSTATPSFTYTAASSAGAGAKLNPTATITFPVASGSSEVDAYFSIGTSSAGTGKILWSGSLSPTITVLNGVTPRLTTGTTITLT